MLKQNTSSFELIIVSNKLSPKHQSILEFLINNHTDEYLKYITLTNYGCPATLLNEGLSCASGEFAWCLDTNIKFNNGLCIDKIVDEIFTSKAQSMFLREDNTSKSSVNRNNILLKHPVSIISQDDWQNASRVIFNLSSIRLFNIKFSEGWDINHGALFMLQIVRFFPNTYFSQKIQISAKFKQLHSDQLVDHVLSLNYILRFAELSFGVNSNVFKILLSKEIEKIGEVDNLIRNSNLATAIRHFLRTTRYLHFKFYMKKGQIEQKKYNYLMTILDKTQQGVTTKPIEMLREYFRYARIKIHCGAHKTATTYIQNILNSSRFDLALQGTIYIHYERLREDFQEAKSADNSDVSESMAYAIMNQASLLSFKKPNILLISDENLIRPNKDINSYWDSKSTYESASNYTCACMPNGYDTLHLKALANIFNNRVELIYTTRNYFDYLLSRHSEFLKWRSFKNFDNEFFSIKDLRKCDWRYLMSDLKCIGLLATITRFEEYKKDPALFANYLAEFDLTGYEIQETLTQQINRSRASETLLLEMAEKKEIGFHVKNLQSIFYDKIENDDSNSKKFKSKIFSNFYIERLNERYNSIDKSDFQPIIESSYQRLADNQLNEKALFKHLPLPERMQQPLSRNSLELKARLKELENKSLYLSERFNNKELENGISAMIRIKNEESTIYQVLKSIQDVFDEIVVIDNNSNDATLEEINRAIIEFPLLKNKLKLRHYRFAVSRCGIDNFKEPQNSPNSLAAFYNYSLKQCNCKKICKWDGDMILPTSMKPSLTNFLNKVETYQTQNPNNTFYGVMKGQTVYKGSNNIFYSKKADLEMEARIFENTDGVFFTKEILWEQLFSLHGIERIHSEGPTFVEYKDTSINEFAHWSIESSLGISPRKSKELNDFNLIKNLTLESNNPAAVAEKLARYGFEEIEFDLFD